MGLLILFYVLGISALSLVVVLVRRRLTDSCEDRAVWKRLAVCQSTGSNRFEHSMLAGLPEPAQRFFKYAIKPGADLLKVAEISMQGQIALGSRDAPRYLSMQAEQILAAPYGFVWRLDAGRFVTSVSGSDAAEAGRSWSRFWLMGVIPLAKAGGNPDHARSAFARYVAEAIFWTPAAVLPGECVEWQALDQSSARMTMTYLGLSQSVDIFVEVDGRLSKVVFQRWSDANPAKKFQLQPFGGYLSEYREFAGFCLPTKIEAGNFFETEQYLPFFRARVTAIRFPGSEES